MYILAKCGMDGLQSLQPPLLHRSDSLVTISPPLTHLVSYVTGGYRDLFENIKDRGRLNVKPYGTYTNDSGCFVPERNMSLLAGRYRFVEVIGSGQSSVLIKAEDTFARDALVSIKVLHQHYSQLGSQEADCVRRLNQADPLHVSGTVRLVTIFAFDDHYCMVFELLHPKPLLQYAFHSQAECVSKLRSIAMHLLKPLAFLHHNNVIHADLKPENILLKQEHDLSSLTLIDFGNALRCVHDELSLYYQDFELQTLLYRSPEVMLGLSFGLAVDMWSLGCIMAELYLGKPLFYGTDKQSVMRKMVKLLGPLPRAIFQRGKFYRQMQHYTADSLQADATVNLVEKLKMTDFRLASFIAGCLRYDPAERLTAVQAARNPFLAEFGLAFLSPTSQERNQSWNMLPSPREYAQKPSVEYSEAHTMSSLAVLRRGTGDYMARMQDQAKEDQAFPIVVKPRYHSHHAQEHTREMSPPQSPDPSFGTSAQILDTKHLHIDTHCVTSNDIGQGYHTLPPNTQCSSSSNQSGHINGSSGMKSSNKHGSNEPDLMENNALSSQTLMQVDTSGLSHIVESSLTQSALKENCKSSQAQIDTTERGIDASNNHVPYSKNSIHKSKKLAYIPEKTSSEMDRLKTHISSALESHGIESDEDFTESSGSDTALYGSPREDKSHELNLSDFNGSEYLQSDAKIKETLDQNAHYNTSAHKASNQKYVSKSHQSGHIINPNTGTIPCIGVGSQNIMNAQKRRAQASNRGLSDNTEPMTRVQPFCDKRDRQHERYNRFSSVGQSQSNRQHYGNNVESSVDIGRIKTENISSDENTGEPMENVSTMVSSTSGRSMNIYNHKTDRIKHPSNNDKSVTNEHLQKGNTMQLISGQESAQNLNAQQLKQQLIEKPTEHSDAGKTRYAQPNEARDKFASSIHKRRRFELSKNSKDKAGNLSSEDSDESRAPAREKRRRKHRGKKAQSNKDKHGHINFSVASNSNNSSNGPGDMNTDVSVLDVKNSKYSHDGIAKTLQENKSIEFKQEPVDSCHTSGTAKYATEALSVHVSQTFIVKTEERDDYEVHTHGNEFLPSDKKATKSSFNKLSRDRVSKVPNSMESSAPRVTVEDERKSVNCTYSVPDGVDSTLAHGIKTHVERRKSHENDRVNKFKISEQSNNIGLKAFRSNEQSLQSIKSQENNKNTAKLTLSKLCKNDQPATIRNKKETCDELENNKMSKTNNKRNLKHEYTRKYSKHNKPSGLNNDDIDRSKRVDSQRQRSAASSANENIRLIFNDQANFAGLLKRTSHHKTNATSSLKRPLDIIKDKSLSAKEVVPSPEEACGQHNPKRKSNGIVCNSGEVVPDTFKKHRVGERGTKERKKNSQFSEASDFQGTRPEANQATKRVKPRSKTIVKTSSLPVTNEELEYTHESVRTTKVQICERKHEPLKTNNSYHKNISDQTNPHKHITERQIKQYNCKSRRISAERHQQLDEMLSDLDSSDDSVMSGIVNVPNSSKSVSLVIGRQHAKVEHFDMSDSDEVNDRKHYDDINPETPPSVEAEIILL